MTLTLEEREAERIYRRGKTRERKAAKASRTKSTKGQEKDADYLAWLHDGLGCIACLIEGRGPAVLPSGHPNVIEAAHQGHTDQTGPTFGRRDHDRNTVPLCTWHHRVAPGCCDPAQRKFWDRLRVDVGAFCQALYAAFKAGEPGEPVIQKYASPLFRFFDGER